MLERGMRETGPPARGWTRALAIAAALQVMIAVASAAAPTVLVRSAPAGAKMEVVLNGKTVSTATADEAGSASLAVDLASIGKTETDVYIYVDVCPDNVRRIVLAERGTTALRPENCDRRDVT